MNWRSLKRWDNSSGKRVIIYLYAAAILFLSFDLAWRLQIFFIVFAALAGALFFIKWGKEQTLFKKEWSVFWLLIPFGVLVFTRVILYVRHSPYPPLGYDMGIYKYEFERAKDLASALKTTFYPGLIMLVGLMRRIGFPVSFFMGPFYILLNLLVGVMVYFAGRQFFGLRAAFFAFLLYAVSLTQFDAYYFFLYKNILALSLLLATFILLDRRSYRAILPGVYLGMVQPPDFLILAVAMISVFLLRFRDLPLRRYLLVTGGTIAVLVLVGFFSRFNQIVEGFKLILNNKQHWDPSISGGGVFINFYQYLEQAIYYIPLGLLGLIVSLCPQVKFQKINLNYLHFAFSASALIVLLKLIFFKRYLIELDLFFILFAGVGASLLYRWFSGRLWQKAIWAAVGVFLLFNIVLESWTTYPLLPPLEAARIGTLCKLPKKVLVMTSDSFYSPWLRGYSCHETIAPGLFELNRWNYEGWSDFWSGKKELIEKKMSELSVYQQPIYIFIGEFQPKMNFDDFSGFGKVQSYLWRWDFVRKGL